LQIESKNLCTTVSAFTQTRHTTKPIKISNARGTLIEWNSY
jgi:hypothetical protein